MFVYIPVRVVTLLKREDWNMQIPGYNVGVSVVTKINQEYNGTHEL